MAFLEVVGLSKSYPGVSALKQVDLSAERGEVHAIVGANGAGKSTLMNILAGAVAPSAGEVRLDGVSIAEFTPSQAQARGISTVYQDFTLAPELSVARNVFLGREPLNRLGLVDDARLQEQTRALLSRYGIDLQPAAIVGALSVAQRQLVEIARALSIQARVLILDEPTAVLSLGEQENLFRIIAELRRNAMLVLYVSHRLDEIFAIADRVTVLRDGALIGTVDTAAVDPVELVRMMIGRDVRQGYDLPAVDRAQAPLLQATYRSGGGDSRLTLHRGEIVGLAGYVGAGRSHLGRLLAGFGSGGAVELELDGVPRRFTSTAAAIGHGVIYLTEDRKRDGSFANLSVLQNTTAAALPLFSRLGVLRRGDERRRGGAILERLRLVARSLDAPMRELSGGNQQKVVFGRALLREPKLLICDEPTRGVDVGAKQEIYELLLELAGRGVAILLISSEVKELLAITHRILVMRDRAVVAAFATQEAGEDAILLAATGTLGQDTEDAA